MCVCVHAKLPQSCPTLYTSVDCSPPDSSVHGDSPGKNTGVGCPALLQGIFLTQGSNMHLFCLLHWQVGSLLLGPMLLTWMSWTLCNPMGSSLQGHLSLEFSRQEYWSGLPCPLPGDLPDPGIKLAFPVSPTP